MFGPSMMWCRRSSAPGTGSWCRICAAIGPTVFRDAAAPRMAEQAAIGQDVIDFADALRLPRFAVAGFDWGGRAAAIAAALHPDRVRATVLIGGYTIQNTTAPPAAGTAGRRAARLVSVVFQHRAGPGRTPGQSTPALPVAVAVVVAELALHRRDFRSHRRVVRQSGFRRRGDSFVPPPDRECSRRAALRGDGSTAGAAARKSWRHRSRCTAQTMAWPLRRMEAPAAERAAFAQLIARRVIPGVGHFMPRERPEAVSSAMLELLAATR